MRSVKVSPIAVVLEQVWQESASWHSKVGFDVECLTLILMALSSTSNITSPMGCLAPEAGSISGVSAVSSAGFCDSGVFAEEASIKVTGVMSELGVCVCSFRGRSKYELPSIVNGISPRERM